MGAKNTRMIAIAYITRLLLPNRKGRAEIFDNKTYWKHCIGTSIAAHLIADETGLCDKDKMFTYGLIHDIGITVLDICLPQHLDKIHTMQLERGVHHIAAEKIILNCNSYGNRNVDMQRMGSAAGNPGDSRMPSFPLWTVNRHEIEGNVSGRFHKHQLRRLLGTEKTFYLFRENKKHAEYIKGIH